MRKKITLLVFCISFISFSLLADEATQPKPEEKLTFLQKAEHFFEENMNYGTITFFMTIESSFIPFPSEIIIPPAAYIASKPESNLNIFLVVFFGTLGAMIGALINYFLALWLGRPLVYKFADSKLGHLLLLSGEKIQKAENYFNDHGKISTFVGRLIPGIRQLISIPAGLAKMNIGSFLAYTALGAGIWNIVLAALGYLAQGQADLIHEYSREIGLIILGIVLLVALYFIFKKLKSRKSKNSIDA